MDQSSQYSSLPSQAHHSSRQMFQSAQLPPPSQLHQLAPSSYSRSNTLPPIPALGPNLSSRYPPASYHPSLVSASPTLPPPTSNSQSSWPTQRTSSSREERYPPRPQETKVKPLIHDPVPPPPPPPSQPEPPKESEDNMPPTSDFVKKLYKYVSISHACLRCSYLLRMLEDPSFQRVVSWGPNGDCFVVKVRYRLPRADVRLDP